LTQARITTHRLVQATRLRLAGTATIATVAFCSAPATADTIDPCLLGVWEATSLTELDGTQKPTGGEGFRVTFRSDGTHATDYANMKPIVWEAGTRFANGHTYRGTAIGLIATANGVATIERVERAEVTMQLWDSGGERKFRPVRLPGLGPGGLGSTARDNAYVCDGDSLEYKSSVAVDKHPTFGVRLKRVERGSPARDQMVKVTGKTWLTATELKDRTQDLSGV